MSHADYVTSRPRDIVLALISAEEARRAELVRQLENLESNSELGDPGNEIAALEDHIASLRMELNPAVIVDIEDEG